MGRRSAKGVRCRFQKVRSEKCVTALAPILLFLTGVLAGLIAGLSSFRVFRARGRVELIENLQIERDDLQSQLVGERQQLHLAEKAKDTALWKADEYIQNFRRKIELLNRDLVESKESAAKSRTIIENLQSERGDLQNQLLGTSQKLDLAEKAKDTALSKADEDIQRLTRKLDLLNRDLIESKESAAKSRTIIENLQSERGDLQNQLLGTSQKLDELETESVNLQNYLDSLESQLSQRPIWGADYSERAVQFPGDKGDDLLERMVNVLRDRASQQTPRQILELVASLSNGSLVLLPSALKSADEASDFELGKKLYDQIWKLATEYRQRRLQGGPDKLAMQVFGHRVWAAREAETTQRNTLAKAERTFVYKGQPTLMQQHLKIGVNDSTNRTLRLHFEWDPEDGVVVIGHCGSHLFVPGH